MPKKSNQPRELEELGKKVREASELIGHLRDRNRALANELEEMRLRLAGGASESSVSQAESGRRAQTEPSDDSQLNLLRQERQQIRDRIVLLLRQLDELSASPPE